MPILGLDTFGARTTPNDRQSILFHRALKITNFNKTVSLSYLRAEYSVINNFKTKLPQEFISTSRIITLCSGCYMQVIKSLGHHLNGCWLCCTGSRHIERSLTLEPKVGPQHGH